MPLRLYKNKTTGEERETLKQLPANEWEEILTAPNQKFMETTDAFRGKSRIKDQEKILKARSRNHSRDVDLDDNIQINRKNGLQKQVNANLLNKSGQRRRKIDDI